MERHRAPEGGEHLEPTNPGADNRDEHAEDAVSRETEPSTPRIYLADNAAFAAGVDRGQWVDATETLGVMITTRDRLRGTSPFTNSTVSIRHHDGFLGLDIRPDEDLGAVHKIAAGLVRYGRPYAAYADAWGTDSEALDNFERYYQGSWPSVEAWAESFADAHGWSEYLDMTVDAYVRPYLRIDFSRLGRELSYDAHVIEDAEARQIHVFQLQA